MAQEALDAETVRKFAEATENTLLLQERMGMGAVASGNGIITIQFQGGGKYALLAGFVAGGVLATAIIIGAWAAREFTRSDLEFAKTDQQLFEIRADLKGVRAYINRGAVAPPEKEKENAK